LISKYKDPVDVSFSKAKRFQKQKADDIPGPGSYKQTTTFTGNGFQFLNKFPSSHGRSLSWKLYPKVKVNDYPGPGHYKIPSEWGIYISKNDPGLNTSFDVGCSRVLKQSRTNSSFMFENSAHKVRTALNRSASNFY